MNSENKKIGIVIANINGSTSQNVWTSFIRSAQREGKTLFIFPGGRLNAPIDSEYLRNPIYSLVNTENLDGFVIWSSSIRFEESKEEFKLFHSRFEPLPYVTITHKIQGHPCIEFEGYAGMKQLLTHCIKTHGARKIAFLRGPEDHHYAEARLKGVEDALQEAGLPPIKNTPLLTEPFDWHQGEDAAAQLFESRNLKPGQDFDTLAGCSDLMIAKAANYISAHGYHIPRDYRAIGFNDTIESRLAECPLSTVKVPYSALGSKAINLLMRVLNKEDNINDIILSAQPLIRKSCGCKLMHFLPPELAEKAADKNSIKSHKTLSRKPEDLLLAMAASYLKPGMQEISAFVKPVIRSWYSIEENEKNASTLSKSLVETFLNHFEKAIDKFLSSNRDPEHLFTFLRDADDSGLVSSSLLKKLQPSMLQIIFNVREQQAVIEQHEKTKGNTILNSLKCELLGARDRNFLVQCLARHLPKIGINTAGIALYNDENTSLWAGGFSPEGSSQEQEQPFLRKLLVPPALKDSFSRGIFLVQPLFTENESLGYFIHNVPSNEGAIFEELRSVISYALKGIFQFEEVVRANQKIQEASEESRLLMLQKEAAQLASEAKSLFLAKVSHEIRTPMNAVLGMSELLLSENLGKSQRRYAEDIKTSSIALLDIINDILDLSKIQSGEMNITPAHYNFSMLVENISSMVHFLVKEKNVSFEIDMKGDIPICLYGDDIRLRQILLNILSNAVKFTDSGYIRLSIAVTDNEICFSISDTGIGMRAEEIPYLFEPFKQSDTVKNRDLKGTGLGLSITKALVEMMNGRIEVESTYGRGTNFRVFIPKVLGDPSQIHASHTADEDVQYSPDVKVLVVDDNTINLIVADGLLRLCNISVFTASSGKQAIEMLQNGEYDIVFMDHMMPEMDGVETTRRIRETGIMTPVIALTANAVTSAKEMMLSAGMDDFLSKPIIKKELNEILAKWIPAPKINQKPPKKPAVSKDAAGEEKTEFWEKLSKIDGLSVKTGLDRASGQKDIYEQVLKMAIKEIEKSCKNLNAFFAAGDFHNFTVAMHSMKSSLANLGAIELSAKAEELELSSARMDSGYCASALKPFLDLLNGFGNKLKNAFFELHQDDGPIDILPEILLTLSRILDAVQVLEFETINNEIRNLEAHNLSGRLGDEIEEIKDALIIMDYDSAINAIQMLLGSRSG